MDLVDCDVPLPLSESSLTPLVPASPLTDFRWRRQFSELRRPTARGEQSPIESAFTGFGRMGDGVDQEEEAPELDQTFPPLAPSRKSQRQGRGVIGELGPMGAQRGYR